MATPVEPPWLTADERAAWLGLAGVAMRLPTVLDTAMRRDAGITFFEYLTMAMLSESRDRTLPMSTIASLTSATLPRLSHVVRRLEQRGWVRRRQSQCDGRITLAELTESGWAVVQRAAATHVAFVRSLIFDQLTSADVRQLARIGDKLLPGLCPASPPPGPTGDESAAPPAE